MTHTDLTVLMLLIGLLLVGVAGLIGSTSPSNRVVGFCSCAVALGFAMILTALASAVAL